MRKFFLLLSILVSSFVCLSQPVTTGRIANLKDGFGSDVTYIGEIKNKLPNGFGLFIYNTSSNALRHAGYFANGLPEGRGVLVFKNGFFSSGNWKKGKLNGVGATLNADGDLYVGDLMNNEKNGKGWYLFKDNGILYGSMMNDKINGRSVFIGKSGNTICDNIYIDGKKNGLGFQYEAENKKLFEGEWNNGEWKQAGNAYNSFLKHPKFYGEKNASQVMAGIFDDKSKMLNDTGYAYQVKEKRRYFGTFKEGQFLNGVLIDDDTSRFVGALNDKGATGYCSYYAINKFYSEGNYVNDFLNGTNCLSINMKKMSVYYGNAVNGEFTGKATFANSDNEIFVGDYLKGDFTGQGYKIYSSGYSVKGSWKNSVCTDATQITDDKGIVSKSPKTIADAISLFAKAGFDNYDIFGGEDEENNYAFADMSYKSLLSLPGSLKKDLVIYDYDDNPVYFSPYAERLSFEKATAKYNELCKQVKAAKIIFKPGAKPELLTGEIKKPEEDERTVSSFEPSGNSSGLSGTFSVNVFIYKMDDDEYGVAIAICDPEAEILSYDDEDWYMF